MFFKETPEKKWIDGLIAKYGLGTESVRIPFLKYESLFKIVDKRKSEYTDWQTRYEEFVANNPDDDAYKRFQEDNPYPYRKSYFVKYDEAFSSQELKTLIEKVLYLEKTNMDLSSKRYEQESIANAESALRKVLMGA